MKVVTLNLFLSVFLLVAAVLAKAEWPLVIITSFMAGVFFCLGAYHAARGK